MSENEDLKMLHLAFMYRSAERDKQITPSSVIAPEFNEVEFVLESNAIESYEGDNYGPGSAHFDGHMAAWHYIRDALSDSDLTREILLETHRLLLKDIDSEIAGVFRKCGIRVGNHVGPAWRNVPILMGIVSSWAHKAETVEDCWDVHHVFETIHPFADGNGRTGRCILDALLVKCGFKPVVVLAKVRQDYYKLIEKWRKKNKRLFSIG